MSRDIKFKLWDIDQKRFISSNDERLFFEFEKGQIYQNGSNVTEYYTLLQFTGLQDNNGQDIYEGDVIEDDEHYYGAVYWCNDSSMWCVTDVGGLCDFSLDKKIIGNIYENPEFLR